MKWLVARGEDGQDFLQTLANLTQIGRRLSREGKRRLFFVTLAFVAQMLTCPRDGVSLFVKQLLDADHILDVPPAVHALAGAALDGFQLREFRLPETQDIGGKAAESGDFADAEI